MSKIPDGWVKQADGSYSPPKRERVAVSGKTFDPVMTPVVIKTIGEPQSEESKLNKTEMARLLYLRSLKLQHIEIQAITLKLAHDCRFTPDFSYIDNDGRLTFEDVKGFQREDALIKIKVAARKFPMFDFLIVKKEKSGWDVEEVRA